MARNNNALKNTGLIVAVVAVAFGIGYYALGGSRSASVVTDSVTTPVAAPAPVTAPRTASAPDPHIAPRTRNSDYTAPGAPRIQIVEERSSALTLNRRPAQPEAPADNSTTPSTDSEASQAAAPPADTASGTDNSASSTPSTSVAADSSAPSSGVPLIPPASAPPSTPPSTPDQDFEQVGGAHNGAEVGQDGAPATGKAQFRVQTGSFAAQQNAKTLADALRSRGYATSTHAEQENGKTVYKVQIGAYGTRAAADKAAQDLGKNGYPAYSSPINP